MRNYKLIIVDDHKMFLDGLLSILAHKENYEIVLTANSGKNIVKYLDINPDEAIDLIITDVNMPDMNGIKLNDYVKANHPKIKILVVSMLHDSHTIHTLTKKDVDGYIPKNSEKKELLLAIENILNGEKYFSQSIKDTYLKGMFSNIESTVALSKREKEVLTLIAQEFTTQEIADKLFLSKYTIESYRKNLISKLNVRNLAGLTKYAIKLGLIE